MIADRRVPMLVALLVVAQAAVLLLMGREIICTCGTVRLWHGEVASAENSQHLTDWYTPSHILHGILFYFGLWLLARHVSLGWRLVWATAIEVAWEVVENTDRVIDHYRTATISLDYYGDSVVNSLADTIAMMLGFWLARSLSVAVSVAIVLGFEVLTAIAIRDGLALNVLMFLWPSEAVLDWQTGG